MDPLSATFDHRRATPATEMVLECLQAFPQVPVQRVSDQLEVPAKDEQGFQVRMTGPALEPTVWYSEWHTHFHDPLEATRCFLFGLTASARLKVFTRGTWEYRWQLESQVQGDWGAVSSVALVIFPFWRRSRVRYLQNDWISVAALPAWIDTRFTDGGARNS